MSLRNQLELASCHKGLKLRLFCSIQFVFSLLTPTAAHSPPLPSALPFSRQHACPAAHPSLWSPTFHPSLLPTLVDGSAGMRLYSRQVQDLLGSCNSCFSSPAETGSPGIPLPSCTLQSDVPRVPSTHRGEGRRWAVSYQ